MPMIGLSSTSAMAKSTLGLPPSSVTRPMVTRGASEANVSAGVLRVTMIGNRPAGTFTGASAVTGGVTGVVSPPPPPPPQDASTTTAAPVARASRPRTAEIFITPPDARPEPVSGLQARLSSWMGNPRAPPSLALHQGRGEHGATASPERDITRRATARRLSNSRICPRSSRRVRRPRPAARARRALRPARAPRRAGPARSRPLPPRTAGR